MSLLPNGYDPQNLEDVMKQQAGAASANQTDQYVQAKKRAVSEQAAGGRLMSGVSNYPLTDLSVENQRAQSGIQDSLASSLAGIPEEDWLNQENYKRSYNLANLVGSMNKPSTLQEALQGIGQIGPLAAVGASFL